MRVITLFDLPTITINDRKEYVKFRKFLITSGFIMMQESVYSKLALNGTAAGVIIEQVKKNKPASGLVQIITLTEKQFSQMHFVVGEAQTEIIDNDERLIIL